MTAERITVVTRTVYLVWSMYPFDSPKSAEIVPKVSPVDISRVVKLASRRTIPKAREAGQTPANFAPTLTPRKARMRGAPLAMAGSATSKPALMK